MIGASIERWRRRFEAPAGRQALRWGKRLFLVLLIAFLAQRLASTDWRRLRAELPDAPLFYLLLAAQFLALPLFDMLIYQRLWRRPLVRHFGVFVQKRAYNFGLIGYSGEALLGLWATRALKLPVARVASVIKDVNILSAVVSSGVTLLCIAGLALAGGAALARVRAGVGDAALHAGTALAIAVTLVPFLLRRRLMGIGTRDALATLALHATRLATVTALQVAQWSTAIPDAPLALWLLFLTVSLVVNRLPLLPNKDLVVLGVTLGLTQLVATEPTRLTALFVTTTGLIMLGNIAVMLAGAAGGLHRGGATPQPGA